jgi:hypothetical protein
MTAAHCRDPQRCSVCLGVTPRVASIEAGVTLVDGKPAPRDRRMAAYGMRGAMATKRKYAAKAAGRSR